MKNNLSTTQLQAVIETAVEGIISINHVGIIKSVNPAAENIFGYKSDELINNNVKMLMPEPFSCRHDGFISAYNQTGEAKIIGIGREVIGLRKDGTQFPMWLSVAEFYEHEERFFAGFISDLTSEKSYLQRARSYENILEHSLNEVYIFDIETLKFVYANNSALHNLQYTYAEMKSKTPLDIMPDYDCEKFLNIVHPLKVDELEKISFTTQHQRKDGTRYPVEVHLETTMYESQHVFAAVILDISERIAAKEKERLNEEQLAHMDRISIFGEMAAGIAHEINQPLTAIGSYVDAGKRRASSSNPDIEKIKGLFEKIEAASHRANDVISHLRMMLRPESKKIQHLNVNKVIRDAVELAKVDKQANSFRFELDLTDHAPLILGDIVQIQQVIINLIRNAIDASLIDKKYKKKISIKTEYLREEERVKVSISDYGCGISKEVADNLFSPFHTTKAYGMGIGLSICESIINSHNGRLWYSNNPGAGTTFHFTLLTELSEGYE